LIEILVRRNPNIIFKVRELEHCRDQPPAHLAEQLDPSPLLALNDLRRIGQEVDDALLYQVANITAKAY
jgi:hypothetical protein